MLPDLSLLVAIFLGLQSARGGADDPWRSVLGTAACTLAGVASIWMTARRAADAARAREDDSAVLASRFPGIWALVAYAGALRLFEWGAFAVDAVPRVWWMARYVLLFLPAAVLYGAAWTARSHVEAAVVEARGGGPAGGVRLGSAVRRHVQRNALALLPLALILGAVEAIHVLGVLGVPGVKRASQWIEALGLLQVAVVAVVVCALSLALPRILRWALRTEPMPEGRVRTLLERTAQAMGLRYGHLVVWRTGGRVINAMVVGITPRTRTIFLSDALLDRLPDEELLAVFAHEAGHAKRRHLPLFLVVSLTLTVLFASAADLLLRAGVPEDALEVFVVLQVAILWFGVLGWLSRKLEREADVFGAEHATAGTADPGPVELPGLPAPIPYGHSLMMRALDRVGRLTGHVASLRHGSIAQRLRFLADHAGDPAVRRAWARTIRGVKVGVGAFALAVGAFAAVQAPSDVRIARATIRYQDGAEAAEEADRLEQAGTPAVDRWETAVRELLRAAEAVDGLEDARSRALRLGATFHAADVVLHGLRDDARARPLLERVRASLRDAPGYAREEVAFESAIDLGRVAARQGQVEEADTLRAAAAAAVPGGERGAYFRARLALLESFVKARRGDAEARRELERLAATRRGDEREWRDLQRDAQGDLDSLPRAQ